ncbi:MAG: SDR family NAD(P)-dependent oxidoreductase [Desulfobacterales bacterium]
MFHNRIIYIPGGSSGIGLAAAKQLAAKGAHVVIFARNPSRLESAHAEISECKTDSRQRFGATSVDVADPHLTTEAMNAAANEFGAPDVLINMAGQSEPRYADRISHAQFDRIIKTNLYGTWNTISALLPHMKAKGGHIVNTSSIAGFIGVFGYADYCASKFAVVGLSEALRMELKPCGIRVSVLCPPDTDTPMLFDENKIKPPETKALSKRARVLSADAVARGLLLGIAKNRFMIIPGFEGRVIDRMRRWAPSLLMHFMDSSVRKMQKTIRNP